MTIGTKPLAPTTACNATSGPFAQIRSIGSRDKSSARVIHPTIVDGEILAFIKTQRLQFSQEGLVLRSRGGGIKAGTKNTNAPNLVRLLRSCRKRPDHSGTANQCDELAPPHSITLLARSRKDSEIFSPSILAVLRLTISSNLVACSTGRSDGLVPLRILTI